MPETSALANSTLETLDWIIIITFMLTSIGIGIYFSKRAGKDMTTFFISGRSMPWFLAGISMVATAFASDTPLWVNSLVRKYGVYYVWQYWATGIGATLAIVLFSRLWHRMRIITDIEFIEIRYSGNAAAIIRGWSAVATVCLFCPLTVGWVTKAIVTLIREAMGLPETYGMYVAVAVMTVALISCAFSGLWGVVYTDFLQWILATAGTMYLAYVSVQQVGGLDSMVAQLQAIPATEWKGQSLSMFPKIGTGGVEAGVMSPWNAIGYFGIMWIGVGIAGAYMAQRMMACKNTRHASYAQLLYAILYTAVISWPWILVALCSMILIPDLGVDPVTGNPIVDDFAYPRMIVTYLPVGIRGVLVMSLLAAFMSTVSTLFNWGSSYLVNDFYKRFLVRDRPPHHYVTAGRVATAIIALVGGSLAFVGEDVQALFGFAMVLGAGGALMGLMRWFWPRLNAQGDLAGGIVAFLMPIPLMFPFFEEEVMRGGEMVTQPYGLFDHWIQNLLDTSYYFSQDMDLLGARMMVMTILVTAAAVIGTYMTRPTDPDHLREFIHRARPFKFFWGRTAAKLGVEYEEGESILRTALSWLLSLVMLYSLIFGAGYIFFGQTLRGISLVAVFAISLTWLIKRINADLVELDLQVQEIEQNLEEQHEEPASR